MMRQAALEVVRTLQKANFNAYWVGGAVRDLLLKNEPKDFDIATSARPEEARGLFAQTREVGKSFGVLQVESSGHWFEVASFRRDGSYSDARHPDNIEYCDTEGDAKRRDFTINALYLDPVTDQLLDYVGGQRDLEQRLIRTVGDPQNRFAEDALRLLRAVRFASRLDFSIEPQTEQAIRRHAPQLKRLASERVRDEFCAILLGARVRRGMQRLFDLGLLAQFAPDLLGLRGCKQSSDHHPEGDVWEHVLRMLEQMQKPSRTLALAVLLHDIAKPESRGVVQDRIHFHGHEKRGQQQAALWLRALKFPRRLEEDVVWLVGQHLQFFNVEKMKRSTLRRLMLHDLFPVLLELHRLDCVGSNGDLRHYRFCQDEQRKLDEEKPPVRPLISGHDLMSLGFASGPLLGKILHQLLDAQLEGVVSSADQAREWVLQSYKPNDS